MTLTVDEQIEIGLADNKILLFRFDAHLRKEVYKRLNTMQKRLLSHISAIGVESISQKALKQLLKEVSELVDETYQDIHQVTAKDLKALLPLQAEALTKIYNQAVKFDLFNQVPDYRIKAIRNAEIIAGAPLEDWWRKQGDNLTFDFERTIRSGMIEGTSYNDLVKSVKEITGRSRRGAETLVRTAVMKVNDVAHEALRDENEDLLNGEQHVSTLDTRTSEICRLRDGLSWDMEQQPIGGHKIPYKRPLLHPNCRSDLKLLIKSWKELGINLDEIPESTKASLDGQVKSSMNYEDWLKTKSETEQDKILGKGKAKLWRDGVITFRDMLDQSGRPLTLEELSVKIKTNNSKSKNMRTNWDSDFPNTVIDKPLGDATKHIDYLKAKSGDVEAAYRLAKDLVSDNALNKLKAIVKDNDFVIVPVHAEEAVGVNMIPIAVAKVLSEYFNKPIDFSIVQATKVSRTGANGWHRLANSPAFDGEFVANKNALILDDTQTQGGTLASLKGHIEQQNGKVIASYALTGKQYSVQLRLDENTLNELRGKYGNIEQWWIETFGYGFEKLTEWEARFILNSSKTPDEVRNLIIEAKQN